MIYVIHTVEVILTFSIIRLCRTGRVSICIYIEEWYKNKQQKRHEQRCREVDEKYLQYISKQKLHKKEREKYPLFYWRELIEEKLEDGNL